MARLGADIRGGRLAPGARLPTEQALTLDHGRQPHRGARGGRRLARRRAGGDAPRLGRLCRAIRRPRRSASPRRSAARLDDVLDVMELRLAVEVEAAALAAERAEPPAGRRHPRGIARHRSRAARAARARSPRTSPSIAPSPRRPATGSSRASSPSSAATSFRARACGCRSTRRPSGAPISSASSTSTPASSRASPTAIRPRRAAPCATISRARSSATASLQKDRSHDRR